jgi:short-subunit dehydrogenase
MIDRSQRARRTRRGGQVRHARHAVSGGRGPESCVSGPTANSTRPGAHGHTAALDWELDVDRVTVNVLGFMAMAHVAMRHFLQRGRGHLVGISSIAALRGNRAAAYAASKAFQSVYLDGLRELARHSGHPIVVTEVQPGAVDTAMLKPDRPLPAVVRRLLVASPAKAARQILRAVQKRKEHAYITRRYALVAFILKFLPRAG